jgi:hypothetical protein
MQNRRTFRIMMTVVCFIFAALNGYKIVQGNYIKMDVFMFVIFLAFGITYTVILLRTKKDA